MVIFKFRKFMGLLIALSEVKTVFGLKLFRSSNSKPICLSGPLNATKTPSRYISEPRDKVFNKGSLRISHSK